MRHRVTLALLVSVCTFLPAAPLAAQTTPAGEQDDVVRITTNLVQVDAVVTKDVPSYTVVAGNPSSVVKLIHHEPELSGCAT